jgi:ribosomal protein S12 methylthiotransferase
MKFTKVGILSLGCPRNLVDSENIINRLRLKKYRIVNIEDAQVAIINTCSFIKEAKEESVEKILDVIELKKQGKINKIIVAGCLPSRYKLELIKLLPEIDAFVGYQKLPEDNRLPERLTPPHYAYVKVSEGCLNNCSYCVIPKIKGPFLSRSIESIIEEVRRLDKKGCREIDIIGQDISQYGIDLYGRHSLDTLLSDICKTITNIKWVRLLYLQPAHLTKNLIKVIANEPAICKYVDLPLQHINDRILKQMNRRITKRQIIALIEFIRKTIPGVGIRTAFIVGFPGETKEEFQQLLDFIRAMRFERLGAFLYSREEDTKAFNFKDQIPDNVKQVRFDMLMQIQQSVARTHCKESIGKIKEVLIDEICSDTPGTFLGRTSHDAPEVDGAVYVKAKNLKAGDIVPVKITDSLEYDLIGEKV